MVALYILYTFEYFNIKDQVGCEKIPNRGYKFSLFRKKTLLPTKVYKNFYLAIFMFRQWKDKALKIASITPRTSFIDLLVTGTMKNVGGVPLLCD